MAPSCHKAPWSRVLTCVLGLTVGVRGLLMPERIPVSRRSLFWTVAGGLTGPLWPGAAVADDPPRRPVVFPGGVAPLDPQLEGSWPDRPRLRTPLGRGRMDRLDLSPLSASWGSPPELYYEPFLFGTWNVTATLKRKIYPFGREYVPSRSLLEGSPRNREEQVGDTCSYEVHYFSTLANTWANQLTVNLGRGVPETKIIPDRAYNIRSISQAYEQLAPVQEVKWDYRDNPTQLTLEYRPGLLAEDMRPLGPRRTEITIQAHYRDFWVDPEDGCPTLATAELCRLVTLAPGQVVVSDVETMQEFTSYTEDHVRAVSRTAVYLIPHPNNREGVQWQQVRGQAVALFDYDLDLTRVKEQFTYFDGSVEESAQRACVLTPNDVIQCA